MSLGITASELARRHGVTRQRVHQWMAHTPGLNPTRYGRTIVLTPAEVRRILARPRGKPGRPKNPAKATPRNFLNLRERMSPDAQDKATKLAARLSSKHSA